MTRVTQSRPLDVSDVDFGFDDIPDLPERVEAMRDRPGTWVSFIGEPALMLTSYELVSAGFREEASIPGHVFYEQVQRPIVGKNVQSITGDEHRVARALQFPFFRQRLMPSYVGPLFEPVANELVDAFADRGAAELVGEFNRQYPMRVIMRVLDLDRDDSVDWIRLAWDMIQGPYDLDAALRAIEEFDRRAQPIIDERRRHPGDDLVSALVTAEEDGERMSDEDVLAFMRLMFPAGSDTTYLGMGNVLFALLTHPDQMSRVVADLAAEPRWAIEEGMRWQPSVAMLPRRTVDDVEWRGMSIAGGTNVLLSVTGANRDPAVFADPTRFDVGRRPQGVLTFGLAAHLCLGIHFARAEMEVALRTLLTRLPDLRLDPSQPPPEIHGNGVLRGPESLSVVFG